MLEALILILMSVFGCCEADVQGKALHDLERSPYHDQAKELYYEQQAKDGGITVSTLGG